MIILNATRLITIYVKVVELCSPYLLLNFFNLTSFFVNHIPPISAPNLFLFKKHLSEFDLNDILVTDLMF